MNQSDLKKECTGCCKILPASVEFFRLKKAGKFGLHSRCRECERDCCRKYKSENREAVLSRRRELRLASIERHLARERDAAARRRRDKWPDVLSANRKWRRKRLQNPVERMSHSVRVQIARSLSGKCKFGGSTAERLGYSDDELRRHLERQFEAGMSWENYGDWNVDHIIPASSFSFASDHDAEFKACWSLTNLRPMWGLQNKIKGAKRLHLI